MADAAKGAWERIGQPTTAAAGAADKYLPYSAFGAAPRSRWPTAGTRARSRIPIPGVSNCRVDSTRASRSSACRTASEPPFGAQDALDQIPVPDAGRRTDRPARPGRRHDQLPAIGVPENYSRLLLHRPPGGHRRPPPGGPDRPAVPADLLLRAVVGPEPQHRAAHGQDRRQRGRLARQPRLRLGRPVHARTTTAPTRPTTTARPDAGTGTWNCPNSTPPVTNHEYQGCGRRSTTRRTAGTTPRTPAQAEGEPDDPERDQGQLHPRRPLRADPARPPATATLACTCTATSRLGLARLRPHRPDRDGERLQRLHRLLPRVPARRPLPQGADRLGPALERLHGLAAGHARPPVQRPRPTSGRTDQIQEDPLQPKVARRPRPQRPARDRARRRRRRRRSPPTRRACPTTAATPRRRRRSPRTSSASTRPSSPGTAAPTTPTTPRSRSSARPRPGELGGLRRPDRASCR